MRRAFYLLTPLLSLACNSQLVGGDCLGGYVLHGEQCVELSSKDSTSSGGGSASSADGGASSSATESTGASTLQTGTNGSGGGGGCGALTACGSDCIDIQHDPFHCGDCGNACNSGVCVDGECQGKVAGHVVVMGIDYEGTPAQSAASRLLGNAVFLSAHAPVRILDFRALSDTTTAQHTEELIASEAAARGRTVVVSIAPSPGSIVEALPPSDVFVIHVPVGLKYSDVDKLTALWQTPLQTFEAGGGVVVVLAQDNQPALITSFLNQSQILTGVTNTEVAAAPFAINDFLDSMTAGVPSPFAAAHPGVALDLQADLQPSATLSIPVVDASGIPVVIHRVIPPAGP